MNKFDQIIIYGDDGFVDVDAYKYVKSNWNGTGFNSTKLKLGSEFDENGDLYKEFIAILDCVMNDEEIPHKEYYRDYCMFYIDIKPNVTAFFYAEDDLGW